MSDPLDRRRSDAQLLAFHRENRERLAENKERLDMLTRQQDATNHNIESLTARLDKRDRDYESTNRELTKIKGALFDEDGKSNIGEILDLMRAGKLGGKLLAAVLGLVVTAATLWALLAGKPPHL